MRRYIFASVWYMKTCTVHGVCLGWDQNIMKIENKILWKWVGEYQREKKILWNFWMIRTTESSTICSALPHGKSCELSSIFFERRSIVYLMEMAQNDWLRAYITDTYDNSETSRQSVYRICLYLGALALDRKEW